MCSCSFHSFRHFHHSNHKSTEYTRKTPYAIINARRIDLNGFVILVLTREHGILEEGASGRPILVLSIYVAVAISIVNLIISKLNICSRRR